jgi:hypothetical protein
MSEPQARHKTPSDSESATGPGPLRRRGGALPPAGSDHGRTGIGVRLADDQDSLRASRRLGAHALAAMRTEHSLVERACGEHRERAAAARPVQQLRQTADGFAGIRPGPMSSCEWLITDSDPRCLNRGRGATGAAPSPVSLGGSASPGKPLTPDQQPAEQKYMATVVTFKLRHGVAAPSPTLLVTQ